MHALLGVGGFYTMTQGGAYCCHGRGFSDGTVYLFVEMIDESLMQSQDNELPKQCDFCSSHLNKNYGREKTVKNYTR